MLIEYLLILGLLLIAIILNKKSILLLILPLVFYPTFVPRCTAIYNRMTLKTIRTLPFANKTIPLSRFNRIQLHEQTYNSLNILRIFDNKPLYFNPSIQLLDNNELLLCYRVYNRDNINERLTDRYDKCGISLIGLALTKLDLLNNLSSCTHSRALIPNDKINHSFLREKTFGIEDCRILRINNIINLICNYFDTKRKKSTMGLITFDKLDIKLPILNYKFIPLIYLPHVNQKNWIPFAYNEELLFVHSINPHNILKYNKELNKCELLYSTLSSDQLSNFRGGTQARLYGNYYIAFAHKKYKYGRYYTHIIYMFDSTPPFRVRYTSKEFLLEELVHDNRDIQYLTGFEIIGENMILTYGRQDQECKYIVMSLFYIFHLVGIL